LVCARKAADERCELNCKVVASGYCSERKPRADCFRYPPHAHQ
jgi:hypothetical protein